jgi:hypothetical protein
MPKKHRYSPDQDSYQLHESPDAELLRHVFLLLAERLLSSDERALLYSLQNLSHADQQFIRRAAQALAQNPAH